jgi:TolB-like protein
MRALILLPLALSAVFLMTACETGGRKIPEPTWQEAQQDPLRQANYQAAAVLMGKDGAAASVSNRPGGGAPLIVATLANVNALDQSSTLGRVISEHLSSWLAQSGQQVVELKVRNGIYMKRNEGEFLLTREIREVAAEHKARGVIVGVYAEGNRMLQVTLKLVDPASSMVLSAYDYTLPLNDEIKGLLRKK